MSRPSKTILARDTFRAPRSKKCDNMLHERHFESSSSLLGSFLYVFNIPGKKRLDTMDGRGEKNNGGPRELLRNPGCAIRLLVHLAIPFFLPNQPHMRCSYTYLVRPIRPLCPLLKYGRLTKQLSISLAVLSSPHDRVSFSWLVLLFSRPLGHVEVEFTVL